MGANSRRRREAKQRRGAQSSEGPNPFKVDPGHDAPSAYAIVELAVLSAIGRLGPGKVAHAELVAITESLRQADPAVPRPRARGRTGRDARTDGPGPPGEWVGAG